MFQAKIYSNKRPVSNRADLTLTTTVGTMQLSDEALKACGFKIGSCVVIASLPVNETGLNATLPNGDEAFYLAAGFPAVVDAAGETIHKQVGNQVTELSSKSVVSSAHVWASLGGTHEHLSDFNVEAATFGFLVNGSTVTPITKETPEDDGDVYSQVVVDNDGRKSLEFQQVASFKAAFESVPFFPITFVATRAKQIKGGEKADKPAKAAKAPKALPTQEVNLDDFDA